MIFRKVLLATDFSRYSMQMVDCIAELRHHGLERVVLAHVVDRRIPEGAALTLQDYDEEIMGCIKERLKAMDIEAEVRVEIGFPAIKIAEMGEEAEVSMIVVASHGKNIITQLLLGSTAQDVVRLSSIPVLVEKFTEMDPESLAAACRRKFSRVLLPTDDSPFSKRVLQEVDELAGIVDEIILMSVIERARDEDELQRITRDREAALAEIKSQLEAAGIPARIIVVKGEPADLILEAAENEDVSLIMMAKRGQGLIKELILGSTAETVVRRAHRPVLVIPCPND